MTRIVDILEGIACKECLNIDPRDFEIYFDFDPKSRTIIVYISCEICGELYEHGQLIKNKDTHKYEIQ